VSLSTVILPPAKGDDQEAAQAAFQQFFLFGDMPSRREPIIVVSDFAIEWPGRIGPTMTLPEAEARRIRRQEMLIFLRPGSQRVGGEGKEFSLSPDDRVFGITLDRGPLAAVGYNVIVGKLGRQWVIKEVKLVWIS
jgi:hypothetical protein